MSDPRSVSAAKSLYRAFVESARDPNSMDFSFFVQDATINVVHPFNDMAPQSFAERLVGGLKRSFDHLTRYDYIAFGGVYENQTWVTSTGYYCGHFRSPWLGIRPTGMLAHLRFGEFHRIEGGKAVESYIYLDIPELMIACGQWPIGESPGRDSGFTGYLPGPMTQDGLQWDDNDPQHSKSSYDMVTQMLRRLATPDEAWRPYWHKDMTWYGPAAFGSFIGVDNFAGFQVPFEQAFSEWLGGAAPGSRTRHFTRFGDGNYICSGGWPSLNAVQAKSFLGQPSQGKRLFMRVCDWWRREGDRLAENWVFVDIPHVLLQMDFDVFATLEETA